MYYGAKPEVSVYEINLEFLPRLKGVVTQQRLLTLNLVEKVGKRPFAVV